MLPPLTLTNVIGFLSRKFPALSTFEKRMHQASNVALAFLVRGFSLFNQSSTAIALIAFYGYTLPARTDVILEDTTCKPHSLNIALAFPPVHTLRSLRRNLSVRRSALVIDT